MTTSQLSENARETLSEILTHLVRAALPGSEEATNDLQWSIANKFPSSPHQSIFAGDDLLRATFTPILSENAKNWDVIDMGSGIGNSAITVVNALVPNKILMIDPVAEALDQANTYFSTWKLQNQQVHTKIDYRQGNFWMLDQLAGEESADLVVSNKVMRYIGMDDHHNAVQQAYRVLKDHGTFIFDLPIKRESDGVGLEIPFYANIARALEHYFDVDLPHDVSQPVLDSQRVYDSIVSAAEREGMKTNVVHYSLPLDIIKAREAVAEQTARILTAAITLKPELSEELNRFHPAIQQGAVEVLDEDLHHVSPTQGHTYFLLRKGL